MSARAVWPRGGASGELHGRLPEAGRDLGTLGNGPVAGDQDIDVPGSLTQPVEWERDGDCRAVALFALDPDPHHCRHWVSCQQMHAIRFERIKCMCCVLHNTNKK